MFLDFFFFLFRIEYKGKYSQILHCLNWKSNFKEPEIGNSFPKRHNTVLPTAMRDLHYSALQDSGTVQSLPLTEYEGDEEITDCFWQDWESL